MLAQQEPSRIYGSAADFQPPRADDSGHLHRLSQRGYQGGSPFGQASQVDLLTVGLAIFPTTVQDAHPFERQSAYGDVMWLAPSLLLLVIVFGPLALGNRASRPFRKGLAQKLGTGPPEMHPFGVAAGLFDRRDPAKALQVSGRGIAIALRSQGDHQTGRQSRTGAG